MFYPLLKIYARLAIKIYCRNIRINHPDILSFRGPLLLAANHPNSFLDGIILSTLFDQPVYSLARGDAFRHKRIEQFLRRLQLLPIYRSSEGMHNLGHNYTTFDACQKTFEKGGIVLIFSEGGCKNEWHLRPLKKGTGRLAITAWENQIPLKVIPVGLNYSSFHHFGKDVHLFFGSPIEASGIMDQPSNARQLIAFNDALYHQLQHLVYEIDPKDKQKIRATFDIRILNSFHFLLLPALLGWVIHAPLFYTCKLFTGWKFRNNDHYDSVLTSLLILLYPFYLVLIILILYPYFHFYALLLLPVMIFTAWAVVQVKYQADV